MFTNENATCDHHKISIIVEQEEIQQFDIDFENSSLNKIYDDINLSEPIMIVCSICKLELKFEDIVIEEFIAEPLLDKEKLDILSYTSNKKIEDTDGEECDHEKISLELYQLVQLSLEKNNEPSYRIVESSFGEKEIYLTCEICRTILYEYFDAELENANNGEEDDEDMHPDIFLEDEGDFDEDEDENDENDS